MNLADYLVIAAVVASAIVGAVRGFLREAVALAAWVIALFLAWHFADLIAPHLGGLMSDSGVRPWAARVIIVLLVLLLGAGVGAALRHFVRPAIFRGMAPQPHAMSEGRARPRDPKQTPLEPRHRHH